MLYFSDTLTTSVHLIFDDGLDSSSLPVLPLQALKTLQQMPEHTNEVKKNLMIMHNLRVDKISPSQPISLK